MRRPLLAGAAFLAIGSANAQSLKAPGAGGGYAGRPTPAAIGAVASTDPRYTLSPTPSIGQVATRAAFASAFIGSNKQFMSRSAHFARQTITSLQVVLPNVYIAPGAGETGPGNAATVTASIEYPAGTFTQLTFNGSTSGTIPNKSYLVSDVATVAIPNNAEFWVRYWFSDPSGIFYVPNGASNIATNFDALAFGTTVADQTMGGTVTASISATNYPLAIIANTILPSGCLIGDSKVIGIWDVRNDATGDGGDLARGIGPLAPYINMGSSGDTAQGTLGGTAVRQALSAYCTFVIDEYGINDLANGRTAAQIAANRTTLAGLFAPLPVYGATIGVRTTSTDSWATTANQTVTSYEATRISLNGLIRAGITGEMNVIDLDYALDPTASGKWPVNGTANWATQDGTHENNVAAIIERRSTMLNVLNLARH